MKSLGAERTVDYNDPDWVVKVKEWSDGGVDKALAIQPGTGVDSVGTIKDNGELITVSGDNTSVDPQRNIEIRQMDHQLFTNKEMIELIDKVSDGKVKVVIEKVYPFEDALDALRKTETRRARGKLVVKID